MEHGNAAVHQAEEATISEKVLAYASTMDVVGQFLSNKGLLDFDAVMQDNLCQIRALYILLLPRAPELFTEEEKWALGAFKLMTVGRELKICLRGVYHASRTVAHKILKLLTVSKKLIDVMLHFLIRKASAIVEKKMAAISPVPLNFQLMKLHPSHHIDPVRVLQFYDTYYLLRHFIEKGTKVIAIHGLITFKGSFQRHDLYFPFGRPAEDELSIIIRSYQITEGEDLAIPDCFSPAQFTKLLRYLCAEHRQFVPEKGGEAPVCLREEEINEVHAWQLEDVGGPATAFIDGDHLNGHRCAFNISHIASGTIETASELAKRYEQP